VEIRVSALREGGYRSLPCAVKANNTASLDALDTRPGPWEKPGVTRGARGGSRADLVAGITLAAYAIPVSLAYATLAGLPPEVGIYGYLLGGLGYAALGSSRYLAIGPTSAISMLVGASIAPLAAGDPVRLGAIASLAALEVAALCLLAWALRLSSLTNFIGETVLLGFKAGAGLTIAMTQLPKLFGVPGGGDHFFGRAVMLAQQLGGTDGLTLAVGLAALGLLVLGDRLLPGRPIALAVVVLAIVVSAAMGLGARGVATVGSIPAGLPAIGLPGLRPRDVDGLVPLAGACLLLAYIEGVAAARALAAKHGDAIDPRREFLGLAGANLLVALGHGYPVAGGLSQSAVNEKAGAQSRLSVVVASATLAVCLVFLTGFVRELPNAVLAAIVLIAVRGLVDLPQIARLRHLSRLEFRVALAALAGVLLLGILQGVLLAAVASILLLLARTSTPHVAFLGRIPGTDRFSDLARNPDNEPLAHVLAFRVESGLVYFNADHVLNAVRERLEATDGRLRLVVCDLSASPYVDLAGARMLGELARQVRERGARFQVVEARGSVRDVLRATGSIEGFGYISRRMSLAEAIADAGGEA
jgi:SulP family sulfate permease